MRLVPWCACGLLSLLLAATGCANGARFTPQPATAGGPLSPAEIDARAEQVHRDPRAYLRSVADRCAAIESCTFRLTRQERRGLFQTLHGPEHIQCWFRRAPFSVRLKWLDENLKYDETVYVAGREGNRVRFVTRWWCPPLLPPPYVNKVSLDTPVQLGESQRPLSEFGLGELMNRTLDKLLAAGEDVLLTYEGPVALRPDGPPVHHLRLEYPPAREPVPVQELYVDVATNLPAATVLERSDGSIHAAYFYEDVDARVHLGDDDFLLPAERAARPPAAPAPPQQPARQSSEHAAQPTSAPASQPAVPPAAPERELIP